MKYALTLLLIAAPLFSQTSDEITFQRTFLLRNVAGTAFNPGPAPWHPHIVNRGAWTTFWGGAAFVAYASAAGPKVSPNETFSTNWITGGAQRTLGSRGLVVFRGSASLEPYTMHASGYPQILQWVSPENGGPVLDRMRAHDLVGEAAVDVAYRVATASFIHLYAAPVGDPAVGTVPYAQRASAEEFAEAPFAYDVEGTAHPSTNVVTAGFGSRWITVEASAFHNAVSHGRHTSFESGGIDSHSARLTITPLRDVALQVSRAELGDEKLALTTASVAYGSQNAAVSAIWAQRETPGGGPKLNSGALEGMLRIARSTLTGRAESVDRDIPPDLINRTGVWRTTHYTLGYIFDVFASSYRVGIGANVDYQTQYRNLPTRYGHKPQTLYAFVRLRTNPAMR